MSEEFGGIKNTATIDIERYNFLLNKEKAFNEYFEDDNVAMVIEKDRWKREEYRVVTVDSAVKEIGSIHNKYVYDSIVDIQDRQKIDNLRLDTIEELEVQLSNLREMSTREFKRWKKRY